MNFKLWLESWGKGRSGKFNDGFFVFIGFNSYSYRVYCPTAKDCGANVKTLKKAISLAKQAIHEHPMHLISFVAKFHNGMWVFDELGLGQTLFINDAYRNKLIKKIEEEDKFAHWKSIQDYAKKEFGLDSHHMQEYLSDAVAGGSKGQVRLPKFYMYSIVHDKIYGKPMTFKQAIDKSVNLAYPHPDATPQADDKLAVFFRNDENKYIFVGVVDLVDQGFNRISHIDSYEENQQEIEGNYNLSHYNIHGEYMQRKLNRLLGVS